MTCYFCGSEEVSWRFMEEQSGTLELCLTHRQMVAKAILFDYWRADLINPMILEFQEKGPRSLDMVGVEPTPGQPRQ